ncbi:MAG: CBS and ACT domain-containing protein [Desulfobacterales bacterium]|jgi:acetoin utilization protein AcuB
MLVKSRMSVPPLTIDPEESLSDAHAYMQKQNVRHLPVVKPDGKMVGLITEDDLLKAEPSSATSLSVWEIHYLLMAVKVKAVMVKDVITTTEDTPIEEAAHIMLDKKIGSLPVMRDDKLVGIITESDIFRTFMELFAAREKGLRITLECPNRAGELAKITKAVADTGGYISACGNFLVDDTTKGGVILKVRKVDRDALIDAVTKIEDVKIIDERKM